MNDTSEPKRAKYITSSSPPPPKPKYSFCESIHATSTSPWHLRILDDQGYRYTGGITTQSLCGLVSKGWDVKATMSEHHLGHTCKRCVEKYREQTST